MIYTPTCSSARYLPRVKLGKQNVGQFPISEDLLASKRNPVRDFMETDMVKNWNPQGPQKTVYCSIRDLKAGNRHVNLVADVTDVSKPMKVSTQFGNTLLLAKALLKDDTGEISLCLWKDQVESVSVGNRVEIRDASVRKFRGKIQLGLGKKGTLKIASDLAV